MASAYPSTIPSFTTKRDNTDVNWAADVNRLQDELAAIAAELGTVPKANFSTVAARLDFLTATRADANHHHDSRYILRSLATTKGTIVVSTSPSTFVGLQPGTDGQALMSDSNQSAGVQWKSLRHEILPGLGNDDHPHYLTVPRHNAVDHTPVVSQLSVRVLNDVSDDLPETGQVLKWDGGEYRPMAESFVSSHAALAGLDQDDHPQYFNQSRHHNRSLHNDIGISHDSLTDLSSGHPHSQYARKASGETISGAWSYTTVPRINGRPVTSGADGTTRIFVRTGSPTGEGIATGDVWFRP